MPALSSHPLPLEAISARARAFRVTPIAPRAAAKARPSEPLHKPKPAPPSSRPRSKQAPAANGSLLAGRYAIDRYLDKGGTSKVYLGWDELCEEEVVIKVLTEEAASCSVLRGHFLVGSRAALVVKHPHVVKTLTVRAPEVGCPYMVMEVLRGELLADLLARTAQLSTESALRFASEAAAGLSAIHAAGIVHCDIKPDNLFLTQAPGARAAIKILDFGLAEVAGQSATSEVHAVRGTAQFMAPEQVLGDPVDARCDVYALGTVLFRMLTGQLPFDLKLSTTLLRHQLFSPAPPPSWLSDDLPPAVDRIVQKALRKNPVNRYRDALELQTDLDSVLAGREPQSSFELCASDVYEPQSAFGQQAATLLGC